MSATIIPFDDDLEPPSIENSQQMTSLNGHVEIDVRVLHHNLLGRVGLLVFSEAIR
jgi:hypothetical protein